MCTTTVKLRNERPMLDPITRKIHWYDEVPCGKCLECKRKIQREWVFRLSVEMEDKKSADFLTFTYDPANVPYTDTGYHTLQYSDFQKFLKRYRKKSDEKIAYFVVGEYGDITKRPHLHAILMNVDLDLVEDTWGKGFIHCGQVNQASITYAMKYIDKESRLPMYDGMEIDKIDEQTGEVIYKKIWTGEKEFRRMSKGIGSQFLTPSNIKLIRQRRLTHVQTESGITLPIPRYYLRKAFEDRDFQNAAPNDELKTYSHYWRPVVLAETRRRQWSEYLDSLRGVDTLKVQDNKRLAHSIALKNIRKKIREYD